MKAIEKTYSLLAYALYFGLDIENVKADQPSQKIDALRWRGKHVKEAAEKMARAYPTQPGKSVQKAIDRNMKWIFANVGFAGGTQRKLEVITSFLILGFDDLKSYSKDSRIIGLYDDLIKKLQWLHLLADPALTETGDYIRADHLYERFTGESIPRIKIPDEWREAAQQWRVAA